MLQTKLDELMVRLNPHQKEAVCHREGPMLVIASPGSGKTSVATTRFAYLLEHGIKQYNICMVTFTNKAAAEMKERIATATGIDKFDYVGTFHSICHKLLRKHIGVLGAQTNQFTIYAAHEQEKLAGNVLKELKSIKDLKVGELLGFISGAKAEMKTPADLKGQSEIALLKQEAYRLYEEHMLRNNALDFDDLLWYMVRVFESDPDTRNYYCNQFKFQMVDEYQDSNLVQYRFIRQISEVNRNIAVVGDSDQSIYAFRSADIRNILNFTSDFPEAKVIKLEDNYRSTPEIIDASNRLIAHNTERFDKEARPARASKGDKVTLLTHYTNYEEAENIAEIIKDLCSTRGYKYGNITLLYRTRAQSTALEGIFLRHGIPVQIVNGFSFFERAEVRDVVSYLKLIKNPDENISLQRIINIPKRGIGDTTVAKLLKTAFSLKCSVYQYLRDNPGLDTKTLGITAKTRDALLDFMEILRDLTDLKNYPVEALIDAIIGRIGYTDVLEDRHSGKTGSDGLDIDPEVYIEQLKEIAALTIPEEGQDQLEAFLAFSALTAVTDNLEEDERVKLMTIHAAKGLEFPVTFIVGMCDGIMPHERSMDPAGLEEERRLAYVAMTRAKDLLYLSYPETMNVFGQVKYMAPSRFIQEVNL